MNVPKKYMHFLTRTAEEQLLHLATLIMDDRELFSEDRRCSQGLIKGRMLGP